ncbi:DUF7501 family protein [Halovenus halobia]|uniref:DUF7501 family protein n=1 Tax=Halovenus halobia TaxID=3396622 RepID=UPI003F570DCC
MSTDTHPPPDSEPWTNPDYCPFCAAELTDPGAGFMDHLDEAPTCQRRFDEWLVRIRDDMSGAGKSDSGPLEACWLCWWSKRTPGQPRLGVGVVVHSRRDVVR